MLNETIRSMTKEQLLELMEIDAKDSVALDGVWFQSVERKFGMDEAMYHDQEAWKRFSPVEAVVLKSFWGWASIQVWKAWPRRCLFIL